MTNFKAENGEELTAYSVEDFPFFEFWKVKTSHKRGRNGRAGVEYLELVAAFDIETTSINTPRGDSWDSFGYMYHWQFCLERFVCFGRTWDEFTTFARKLSEHFGLHDGRRLVIYVHNLAFEFQFLSRFFTWSKVFATDPRKPLTAVTGGLEFRCSYRLTNMSLAKLCEATPGIHFAKLTDVYDYKKIRTPKTELTDTEKDYCYCDVAGLCEAIRYKLQSERDTLATIPLTSTGYVRRICRAKMRENPANAAEFQALRVSPEVYMMLLDAFRGGNTSSNPAHCGAERSNVYSFDAVSCYPYVMLTKYYPAGPFLRAVVKDLETLRFYLDRFCCLFYVTFKNIRVKPKTPIAYISQHKCNHYARGTRVFNGRVLESEEIDLCVTELDFKLIESMYTFSGLEIGDVYYCERGPLPAELRECVMEFFENKTRSKGGDPYFYAKNKALLNSIFGMTCTALVHDNITYTGGEELWDSDKILTSGEESRGEVLDALRDRLDEFYDNRNSFLAYQWGVWITAHARTHLQRLIDTNPAGTVYCDTDSDKMVRPNFEAVEALNRSIQEEDEAAGAFCDYNGRRYFLGVFECEGKSERFLTYGAKKYIEEKGGKLKITIAGVNKKKGAEELEKKGGFKAFAPGIVFGDTVEGAAGIEARYNDDPVHFITVDGVRIKTAANIGMRDSTYKLNDTTGLAGLIDNVLTIYGGGFIM